MSDFREKANHFNKYFASICTPIDNSGCLPISVDLINPSGCFSTFNFADDGILKIIRALDINKAHGHDEISVRMIKICDDAIIEPLSLIYKNCIENGTFPAIWKKSNIIPVHKKGDKQIINNYRSVSLLPIFGKIFEIILFNSLFNYIQENNLLCGHQSGFQPNDSCVYQLLSIVHDIYASFDCSPLFNVRGIFLDMSKAFDKVWHEGLIYKMK